MKEYTVNNTTFTFDEIIYVDAVHGNDSNDGSSWQQAFKTIDAACMKIWFPPNIQFGMILADGYYVFSDLIYRRSQDTYSIRDNALNVFGQGLNTTVYSSLVLNTTIGHAYDVTWHRVVFRLPGGTNPHGVRARSFKMNNCVIDITSEMTFGIFGAATPSPNPVRLFTNCINVGNPFLTRQMTRIVNSYGDFRPGHLPVSDWNYGGNLIETTKRFDSEFNIVAPSSLWMNQGIGENPDGEQAHIGVYGGEFAWGNWAIPPGLVDMNVNSIIGAHSPYDRFDGIAQSNMNKGDIVIGVNNTIQKSTLQQAVTYAQQVGFVGLGFAKNDALEGANTSMDVLFK